jgi:hypothetical protein
MKILSVVFVLVVIVLAAALLPVRPYLDFQLIFHANLGLLRGISLYDHAGQVNMIAQMAQVSPEQVYVLPFPYPPWYALSTLWLAMMPIDMASRAWFAANLAMLFLSAGLLTSGLAPAKRILFFLGAVFWMPILGGLFVGQYGFPVLLGAALMIFALRAEKPVLAAIAAALLTFKPHLGGLVLVFTAVALARRRDAFGRNALLDALAAGVILFAVGFVASPNWPLEYFRSLTGFKDVSQCGQCVSIPMAFVGFAKARFDQAMWISLPVAILLLIWGVRRWRALRSTPGGLVAAGILITMLVSPYLQNYDYLLLLVPLIELARRTRRTVEWIAMALAYGLPYVSLALWGTRGNASLIVSACILFGIAAMESWSDDRQSPQRSSA